MAKRLIVFGMACYRNVISVLLLIFLAMPRPVFAGEVLSDKEAYSRVYSYCYSRVSPMWSPKDGERPPRRTSADREKNARLTVECMKEKGVPVRYDMSAGIVQTGTGFGKDVHIKPEDIFPKSVLSPDTISREMPEATKRLRELPLPKLDADDMVPPEMRGKYKIDINQAELARELETLPERYRARLRGLADNNSAPDRQETEAPLTDFDYMPVDEEANETASQEVKTTDPVEEIAAPLKDESAIERRKKYVSSDDKQSSDNVSAAGQGDDSDEYKVKPIFLGR